MPELRLETTEAMVSAMYRMPFADFLGEGDVEDRHCYWFHLGEKPKDMRVTLSWSKNTQDYFVLVTLEWLNYHADPRNPLKGEQTVRINTQDATQADLTGPTTNAVLKVLETFEEVRTETGVAGKISDLAPEVPDVADDPSSE